MNYNKEAALSDEALIRKITEGLDMNNPKDIEAVYNDLQSGIYSFQSEVGIAFDDEIYEKYQKIKAEGTAVKAESAKGKKKKDKEQKSSGKKKERSVKDYGDAINELVEIELKKQEKKRKLFILLAAAVAVLSLGYFGIYNFMSTRTNIDYEALSDLKGSRSLASGNKDTGAVVHKTDPNMPGILPDYETLYEKNKSLVGWLYIDGTKIDYPVMQTVDNDYYLDHNFNQEKDNNGSLFLDCACSVYPRSTNMIIYGHHMKSGNMFGNLQKYAKESYWKEHHTIEFDTIYEHATYEVMYAFYSKVYDNDDLVFKYYQFIDANSDTEFDYYMNEMEALSLYDTGVTASYGDSLLTLSTCDHSQTDGRFAVVAKRVN